MNYDALFEPKSIAVIGASTRAGNVGNDIVKNLVTQGFQGEVYPVNPHATELYGKKCYEGIGSIPNPVDLAIVVVPATAVVQVVTESVEKGVSSVVVISAGFREIGNMEAEEKIRSICDAAGVALLGPNCLGVINPSFSMNASFATRLPRVGSIAFLSQSGALCTAMLDYAENMDLGFSKFVSLGNKAQIDEVTLMRFLEKDPETEIIVLYVEQLTDAKGFVEAVRQLRASGKPVLIVKSGVTSIGAGASASHTGAIAGNDAVYDALFEKAGAIRVCDFDDLFEYLSGFASKLYPKGNRIAVLTNAGGPGVLTTDEVILSGLQLANLSEETQMKLKSFLPMAANSHNPVDILGDADALRYRQSLEILLGDEGVDCVVVVLTPQSMTQIPETAQAIIDMSHTSPKVIYVAFMGSTDVEKGITMLRREQIPISRFPQKAVRSLYRMYRFAQLSQRSEKEDFHFAFENIGKAQELLSRYPEGGDMSFSDALGFFKAYGFSVTKSVNITDISQARKAVEAVGGTAAFKILSSDIVHKSDVGGVALSVSPDTAEKEFEAMMIRISQNVPEAHIDGVLVAEMILEKGVEFILGSVRDSNLGHAVMVGFGGVYVEVFRDVAFGMVPVSREDAKNMIEKLKSKALLRGVRGGDLLDEEVLLESIGRMSRILQEHPEIVEADINPLVIFSKGSGGKVLDARVALLRTSL